MLSSRNRRLKRLSRFIAFFVIVISGCYYQAAKLVSNFREHTSSDEFMEQSPFVPPFVRQIHMQRKTLKKHILGGRLPPEDEHEINHRNPREPPIKNPYTQALKRQAFFKVRFLRFLK